MKPEKLICNSTNITYDKGYVALWLEDCPLPDTLDIGDDIMLKKDHFHVSLLCVKNILESKPGIENEILNHFCDFVKEKELKFEGFTKEFRIAIDAERKSVVALCKVSNLNTFADYLSEKIGVEISHQPAHVTIYTLQPNVGIGLNSTEELQTKSEPVEIPDEVKTILL
jgi:hypothetical protein